MRPSRFRNARYVLNYSISQGIDIRRILALVPDAYINATARVLEEEMSVRMARLREKIELGMIEENPNGMSLLIYIFECISRRAIFFRGSSKVYLFV